MYDSLYDEDVLVVAPLLCIVCDNPMASQLCNHLVELSNDVFTTSSDSILKAVSIVHDCSNTCVFQESASVQTMERERVVCNQLEYHHDWTNRLYCFNVYCIN